MRAFLFTSLLFAIPAWAQDEAAEPATETTEPATETAEPAAETAEPAAETAEPTAETAEPAETTETTSETETESSETEATEGESAGWLEAIWGTPSFTDDELGITVAAKLGGTIPTSALGVTYFIGFDAAYQLPVLERLIGVGLELSFGGPGESGTIAAPAVGGSADYDISMRLITLALEVSATRTYGDFTPYAALGYGFHFLHANVEMFGDESTEDQARAGFQLRGGCNYPLGPGDIFAELRFHYVQLRFLSTGKSNAGGVTLNAGYRYTF